MISVVLADDHVHVRKAIWYLLQMARDIQVVATASNGVEAVMAARFNRPDVVIMDISMPQMDGLEATHQILADFPSTKVLMLSGHNDEAYIKRPLDAGAAGYIVKEAVVSQLLEAVRSIYDGKRYFCREVADKVYSYIDEDSNSWAG
jgi:two-component system, NarL family, nitrate/nitrite response regulator NarL